MDQKYSVLTRISKITFKTLLIFHCLNILLKNLHKGTSQEYTQFDGGTFFNFCFFAIYSASKIQKQQIKMFAGLCAINSAKKKNSTFCSHKYFELLRSTFVQIFKQNCQTIKEKQHFEGQFFKLLVKTLYFCPIFKPFCAPITDLQMSIKSESLRVRESVSTF